MEEQTDSKQVGPLSEVQAGSKVSMVSVEAGKGLKAQLAAMGLLPGVEITVVRRGHPGPLVVEVKGSKMMLGRGMAHRIIVQ